MKIDITKLMQNLVTTLNISGEVIIPDDIIADSRITRLDNVKISGCIKFNSDDDLELDAKLSGVMTLQDDITLEPVDYNFETDFEEILEKNKNVLDITDILWQNILVEVPSKVRATSQDIELSGDGWRVISEDTFMKERNKQNNPFSNLDELLKSKEDK